MPHRPHMINRGASRSGRFAIAARRIGAGWVGLILASAAVGEGSLPDDGTPGAAEVLEVLFPPWQADAHRRLRAMRRALAADSTQLPVALALARECVVQFRTDGDPRHLSHAEAGLAPWWSLESPPTGVLLWRSTLRQSRHQFDVALRDLDTLVVRVPGDAQAWLTRATVLQVTGDLPGARESCQPLRALAGEFIFTTAECGVASLQGEGEASFQRLKQVLGRHPEVAPSLREWALTLLAEIASRLGRVDEADRLFREAVALEAGDPYLLGAWADFLLDRDRPREALEVVAGQTENHALLLRWVSAHARLGSPLATYADGLVALCAAERAAEARGESVHLREQARLHLDLLDDPSGALDRAMKNWSIQKEPADARLLVRASQAAGRPAAAAPALTWCKRHGVEDVVIGRALAAIKARR